MSVCFSGKYKDFNLAQEVYNYFETKCYPDIVNYLIELYHTDLSNDNVKGWQEQNDDEFLIHIDTNLSKDEYIKTIFHELVHCTQDIRGLNDNDARENEAYKLEEVYYNGFVL